MHNCAAPTTVFCNQIKSTPSYAGVLKDIFTHVHSYKNPKILNFIYCRKRWTEDELEKIKFANCLMFIG